MIFMTLSGKSSLDKMLTSRQKVMEEVKEKVSG